MTNWQTVPMGDLCTIQSGKSDTKDAVADGPYAFFDRSKSIKRSSRFLRDCEALIIPGEGTEFLPRHFVGKFDLHQRAYALFDFSPRIEVKYLYHYLHYVADYFPSVAVGATVKSLRLRHFEQLPVRLADPAKQRRIVAILDEAFEGIATAKANAERNLQNARELFESRRGQIFSAAGDDWTTVLLGDACSIARGGSPRPIKEFLTSEPEGVNWVKISDATASAKYIFATAEKIKRTGVARSRLVHDGDFLLSNSMSFGRPYIMRTTGCIHDGWLVLSDYQATFSQDFLYLLLSSSFVYQQFDRLAAGSTVRNLNIDLASSVRVPAPPLDAQVAIAAELDELSEAIDKLSNLCRQKVAAFVELKKSLLHQAFTGALTAKSADKQVAEVA